MTERLEKITEHHERALSAKDEGEARLRNKAIRARSWTVKGPDIKGEAMVLPTEDWDYLIDKGVELAVALAEVERLRGVVELTFQLIQEMGHNPTLPPMAILTWLDLLAALAEPEAKP